jgi:hypothetical protein
LQKEDKDKWYEAKRRKCEVRLIFRHHLTVSSCSKAPLVDKNLY